MTSRERIKTALEHREPDRIPLDLGGTESSGMIAVAYNRLRDLLGLGKGETQIIDVYQQVVKIEGDVRSYLEIDTVPLINEPLEWQSWTLPDGSSSHIPALWKTEKTADGYHIVRDNTGKIIARMPAGSYYFESLNPPLTKIDTVSGLNDFAEVIAAFDWPSFTDEPLSSIAARAHKLHETTDYAVVANLQFHLLAAGQLLRGYENFMTDLMLNKPLAEALLAMLADAYIERCDRYFDEVGGSVDVVLVNDDLGTQQGPMLSPKIYREMLFPLEKRLFSHIKKRSGASLLFHSCGAVREFIPDLIEAGVDALNPVQVSAAGMESSALKRDFGDAITFWGGGCDTQSVLCRGTKQEVRDEVKRRIGDFAPGGGFVFTQVHNIQPDVPPENIMAMYEAFMDARKY